MLNRLKECDTAENARPRDWMIGAGLTIALALLVATILMFVDDPLGEAIALTMFPGILVVGTQWAYLRGRSWRVKALLIGGPLVILFLIGLVAGLWLTG